MNEAYYEFMLRGRTVADGVSVLDAAHLVPMKMKAWLDLTEKKAYGIHVNDRDLRKHRQDVFRLFPLISEDMDIATPLEVYDDILEFIKAMENLSFEPKTIGLHIKKDEMLKVYRSIYKTS